MEALFGLVMGFLLSLLGAGGSLFIVPVLILVFRASVRSASGTSLGVVCAGAAVGAVLHAVRGRVRADVLFPFGAASMLGAILGSTLHRLVPERVSLMCLAAALVLAAYRLARGAPREGRRPTKPLAQLVPLGAGVGVLTGFLGVGGGFLILPVLVEGVGLSMHQAVGTSLGIIALSSATGAVSHAVQGNVERPLLLLVGGGAVVGALLGAPLAGRLRERPLRLAFAGLAGLAALALIARAFLGRALLE
jgi:uncharacterized membrane protein YfcA